MRILITGCTPEHTGKSHPLNYALTSHLLAEGLRGSGHQVDQRAVGPGEKKLRREYDHALVYRFNPEAGSARHILGALYTLVEFPRAWDSTASHLGITRHRGEGPRYLRLQDYLRARVIRPKRPPRHRQLKLTE